MKKIKLAGAMIALAIVVGVGAYFGMHNLILRLLAIGNVSDAWIDWYALNHDRILLVPTIISIAMVMISPLAINSENE